MPNQTQVKRPPDVKQLIHKTHNWSQIMNLNNYISFYRL